MLEIDAGRAAKWDQGAEDASVTKAIVQRMDDKLGQLNGTVAGLKEEHLIHKGMLLAMRLTMALTFAVISAAAAVTGIVVAVIKLGG